MLIKCKIMNNTKLLVNDARPNRSNQGAMGADVREEVI